MFRESVFVGRTTELARLHEFLSQVSDGQGTVVFVKGEAGSGKSVLVNEFLRQAAARNDKLVAGSGQCSSQIGFADAYLPFREIITMLAEARPSCKATTPDQEERLGRVARKVIKILVEVAPDVIDIFVPGTGVLAKIGTLVLPKGIKERLQKIIRGHEKEQDGAHRVGEIDQGRLFGQVTNLFIAIAQEYPLVLFLDDLQWADQGTLDLLFHLGRKVCTHPILIIGTYRPNDVALGRDGKRHPLLSVVNELMRYYGDIEINLDEVPEDHREAFVHAYIDANYHPNNLGLDFRLLLLDHTEGNPLFIAELLRDIQERGMLVQEEEGNWTLSCPISFDDLPIKVERVIEERIGRLTEELRDILICGSVEGERFTVQVIARIREIEESELLEKLEEELSKRHQFISEDTIEMVDSVLLFLYRFRHSMFHSYLYNGLGAAQRLMLHRAVGECLEKLYGSRVEDIAPQLARHFAEGRQYIKASEYALIAARKQAQQYSLTTAKQWCKRGFEMVKRISDDIKRHELLLGLNEVLGDVEFSAADYRAAQASYKQALKIAQTTERQADLYRRIGDVWERQGKYDKALEVYRLGDKLLENREHDIEWARLQIAMAWIHNCYFEVDQGRALAKQALPILETTGRSRDLAWAYKVIAASFAPSGKWEKAIESCCKSKQAAKAVGDKWRIAECDNDLSIYYRNKGELGKSLWHAQQGLAISIEIANLDRAAWLNGLIGAIHNDLGEFEKAVEHGERGMAMARQIGDTNSQEHIHRWLGNSYLERGELDRATDHYQSSLLLAKEIHPSHTVQPHSALANVYILKGEWQLALRHLQEGLAEAERIQLTRERWKYFEGFGQVYLGQGNLDMAIEAFQKALDTAQETKLAKGIVSTHLSLAEALLGKRAYELAMKHIQEAMRLAERCGYRLQQGRAKCLLGQLDAAKHEWTRAEACFKESSTILRSIGARYQLGRTLYEYARTLEAQALTTGSAVSCHVQEMLQDALLMLNQGGISFNSKRAKEKRIEK